MTAPSAASSSRDHSVENCPFCGFRPESEYHLRLHMEEQHPEGGPSPFVVQDQSSSASRPSSEDHLEWAACPICDEVIAFMEMDEHVDLHSAEHDGEMATTSHGNEQGRTLHTTREYKSPYGSSEADQLEIIKRHGHGSADERHQRHRHHHSGTKEHFKNFLNLPAITRKRASSQPLTDEAHPQKQRLGKAELGRFANEDAMPDWLITLLRQKGQVIQGDVIPIIARLLKSSRDTQYAYLCHPAVDHISKLRKEGGFCGYRNIQMLASYVIGARAEGAHVFDGHLPSIFDIQEFIEEAWDRDINAAGRTETGGVRGTRKYIGTPEAQAVFLSLDIPCDAQGFKDPHPGNAEARLVQHIESYFEQENYDVSDKVRRTRLPPIYFQHRGHSMTIVGFEKKTNGSKELLVFDPMFHDSDAVMKLRGMHHSRTSSVNGLLKQYRRGSRYLGKYTEFEILKLTSRLPDARTKEEAAMGNYSPSGRLKVASQMLP
ncbi:hypothetical protein PFICI_12094 [Pestalotiopsis fici W106-1]|uniref:UFSP1/2/DUB catalytic domain-containing protein n=1 Tax=Pestalotiopsis fici (strain W106-1 / CGMCC3.15140) TaxID=1229662 RepID=W3WU95_PESFW|nr:uncharacterized protein PFICI_12094 [Pestalotiopsis fici W106-1]ETS76707.1 hypothetical protein PFICI_12094 [Pestalotiopsis fici W106-1]